MPTGSRREDTFIRRFLSTYENRSWADAKIQWPDKRKRKGKAVDARATRKSDGRTLAIEHTIIEPFVSDKEDFAFFAATFLGIEEDTSLAVPGRWIQVLVPVGTLRNQPNKAVRDAIVQAVHDWIKSYRLALPEGVSQHPCSVTTIPGKPPFDITLHVKVVRLQHGPRRETGVLHVRRQQVDISLGKVVEKALLNKLPKLTNTPADKRILLLERQHMNLYPHSILDEIDKRRASFPQLALVSEIWFVETALYETTFGGAYLRFELYENGNLIRSFEPIEL